MKKSFYLSLLFVSNHLYAEQQTTANIANTLQSAVPGIGNVQSTLQAGLSQAGAITQQSGVTTPTVATVQNAPQSGAAPATVTTPITANTSAAPQPGIATVTAATTPIVPNVPPSNATTPTASPQKAQETKFKFPLDVIQKALDDATAFVLSTKIETERKAVCIATTANGMTSPGYMTFKIEAGVKKPICQTPSVQGTLGEAVSDVSKIKGIAAAKPYEWKKFSELTPDQMFKIDDSNNFIICAKKDADGSISNIGVSAINDQNKVCFTNSGSLNLLDDLTVILAK